MTENRSTTLKVLCILSWVYIGLSMISTTFEMAKGPVTPDIIEEQKSQMLEMYTEDQIEQMGGMLDDIFVFMEVSNEQFYAINTIGILTLLLGLLAVIMMFKMNRAGYYLYLTYTIAPIASAVYFFPGNFMSWVLIVFSLFFGALFAILYGLQLKTMK